jgi:signal transduction histidine kinase
VSPPSFIVRISSRSQGPLGTGFLVEGGLIITCSHVIDVVTEESEIFATFATGRAKRQLTILDEYRTEAHGEDLAVLRVEGVIPPGVRPADLVSSARCVGRTARTFGYPKSKEDDGLSAECQVVGSTEEAGHPVLQLRSQEVSYGFSGAPLWDDESGGVIGVVMSIVGMRRSQGAELPFDPAWRQTETAFARPIELVRKLLPRLTLRNECPYRGLEAFRSLDSHLYFGRDRDTSNLLSALSDHDFLCVLGLSGSGKSSLLRAGLNKGLILTNLPGLSGRTVTHLIPSPQPMLDLFLALGSMPGVGIGQLAKSVGVSCSDFPTEEERRFLNDTLVESGTVGLGLKNMPSSRGILVVDQFERLYTDCAEERVRDQFIFSLLALAGDEIKIIVGVRADFYGRLLTNRELHQTLIEGLVQVSPMNEAELREAILGPAQAHNCIVEPQLVERLVADVKEQPGSMPLLEFALAELWRLDGAGGTLTLSSYDNLGFQMPDGTQYRGLRGAVAQRAEAAWELLGRGRSATPNDVGARQKALQSAFMRLVSPETQLLAGGPTPCTSRRAWKSEFSEIEADVVETLVQARILSTGIDSLYRVPTVEVAHESVIDAWPRLRRWIAEKRAFIEWYASELVPGMRRWLTHDRVEDLLIPEHKVGEARDWLTFQGADLAGEAHEYIQSSIDRNARRTQERELLQMQEEMRRMNSLLEARVHERTKALEAANRELEGFTYSVSHDLRAPLRAIMGTSMILMEDYGALLDEEGKSHLSRQAAAAKRLGVLIDDLLRLARLGRVELQIVEADFSAIATEVSTDLSDLAIQNNVRFEIEEGLSTITDRAALRVILSALLENACKFSPEGGVVRVGRDSSGFFVRDEGIGFEMVYVHKIFQPFEKLHRDTTFGGTGVGLANALRIIERLGGRLWAESELGQGSKFSFAFGESAPE